jgi:protein arginine N-methyltransferase 5
MITFLIQDWTENVIGKVSEWIDLDNLDPNIRRTSESCVRKEHLYASHLGIQSIIIPSPKNINSPNYCRTIMNLNHSNVDIWLRIPISNQSNLDLGLNDSIDDKNFSWNVWDNFRHISNSDKRVSVALEIDHINDELIITPGFYIYT